MSSSRLVQLAEAVLRNAKVLEVHFEQNKLPEPSFDADGPTDFGISATGSPHVENARVEAIEAASELADLLQGPVAFLRPITAGVSLHAISRWDIATKVPLNGSTTFSALASQCGVHEADMRRVLRYAMAHHRLFREPRPGVVAHSLASRLLAEQPLLRDGFWLLAEQYFTAAPHAVLAMEKWGDVPQEPNHTAFNLVFNTDKAAYEFMSATPEGREIGRRFALAMTSFARFSNRPTSASSENRLAKLTEAYPWATLGRCKVVDVGGSRGSDAIHLARLYPELSFVVQDLPPMIEGAQVPDELRDRITFVPYSFFTPQTVSADVYMIKQCFHNWPDHYCVRILRNQVPALRSGARLVVIDSVVPPPGSMSLMDERNVRAFDVMMLTNSSGREREEEDWHKIFKEADERFKVNGIRSAHAKGDFGPASSVIEVLWMG